MRAVCASVPGYGKLAWPSASIIMCTWFIAIAAKHFEDVSCDRRTSEKHSHA